MYFDANTIINAPRMVAKLLMDFPPEPGRERNTPLLRRADGNAFTTSQLDAWWEPLWTEGIGRMRPGDPRWHGYRAYVAVAMKATVDDRGQRIFSDRYIQMWLRWKCPASVELYGQITRDTSANTAQQFSATEISASRNTALARELPLYEMDAQLAADGIGNGIGEFITAGTFGDASGDEDDDPASNYNDSHERGYESEDH